MPRHWRAVAVTWRHLSAMRQVSSSERGVVAIRLKLLCPTPIFPKSRLYRDGFPLSSFLDRSNEMIFLP
jgi:hypothetical protein